MSPSKKQTDRLKLGVWLLGGGVLETIGTGYLLVYMLSDGAPRIHDFDVAVLVVVAPFAGAVTAIVGLAFCITGLAAKLRRK